MSNQETTKILEKNLTKFEVAERGEEDLHKVYHPKVKTGETTPVVLGIDVGSTQSRGSVIINRGVNRDACRKRVIPSRMALVNGNTVIESLGENLYDNMHSKIGSIATDKNGKEICGSVVRGSLLEESSGVTQRMSTSLKKTDTQAFFLTAIDAIAYTLLMDCEERRIDLSETYEVYLGLSLPPSELDGINKDKFILDLTSSFIWENSKYDVRLNIVIKDIILTSEVTSSAETFHRLNFTNEEKDLLEYIACVEGGGRSSSSGLIIGGKFRNNSVADYDECGNKLIQSLRDFLNKTLSKNVKVDKVLTNALETGYAKIGRETLSIQKQVKSLKKSLGTKMFDNLVAMFDTSSNLCSIDMVEVFFFSGRLFRRGEIGYSVLDSILENLRQHNKGFYAYSSTDGYLISTGNALIAYDKYKHVLSADAPSLGLSNEDVEKSLGIELIESYVDVDGNVHEMYESDYEEEEVAMDQIEM